MANIDRTDTAPIFQHSVQPGQRPELMLSAVLHLMSHYTANAGEGGCVKLASVIERHLKALATLPGLAPVLAATCQQLSDQWAYEVERAMPVQESFLARLMARHRTPAAAL
ncbi:hypothetical protein GCM10027277_24340 [Pseudoduganella ginsengisoli]|uniref:Uncharacterized protein n=1 Tax=Pseudoduganella ginsengisoli TaxID=1462440 RepID=A0A6L6Q0H9_9BURK|nr:hypothetical protein [Pseudoduganella ginsengisoli]MTW02841.1 hypothetical protein [Pseudoduganella ginsengisoli]